MDLLMWMPAMIKTTPQRWLALTEHLPDELLTQTPKSGEWSAVDCLLHLMDAEEVLQFRLKAFLDGQDFLPNFDPATMGSPPDPEQSPRDLAQAFARRREASLRALEAVTPDDLKREARHEELGQVTLAHMLNEWATHDLNHTMQAEQALMQPFLRAVGPWRVYFETHVIE